MESRGFGAFAVRTELEKTPWRSLDWFVVVAFWALAVALWGWLA